MASVETDRVADFVRKRIKKLKISTTEVAKRSGIPQKAINKILAGGKCLVFDPDRMSALAKALRTSVSKLIISFGYYEPDGTLVLSYKDKMKRIWLWIKFILKRHK